MELFKKRRRQSVIIVSEGCPEKVGSKKGDSQKGCPEKSGSKM